MKKSILFFLIGLMITFNVPVTTNPKNLEFTTAATSVTQELFIEGTNNYAVLQSSITKGKVFSFFGFEWKVVNVKGDTATFWMTEPYRISEFNNGIYFDENPSKSNIWNNGYKNATWNNVSIGGSTVRDVLAQDVQNVFKTKDGWNRVVTGAVEGVNEINTGTNVSTVFYRKHSTTTYTSLTGTQKFIADSNLSTDQLWLPSVNEVKQGGIWDLDNSYRSWTDTSKAELAWLRTPSEKGSHRAALVGYANNVEGVTSNSPAIFDTYVNRSYGVRPAVNLNINTTINITEPIVSINLVEGSTANVLVNPVTTTKTDVGEVMYAIAEKTADEPDLSKYSTTMPTVENLAAGDYKIYTKFVLKPEYVGEFKNEDNYVSNFTVSAFSELVNVEILKLVYNTNLTVGNSEVPLIKEVNLNVTGVGAMVYAVVLKNSPEPEEIDYSENVPTVSNLQEGSYTVYCKYAINDRNSSFYSNSTIVKCNVDILKNQDTEVDPETNSADIWKYALIIVCGLGVISVIISILIVSLKRH